MNSFERAKIRFLRAICCCGDDGAQRKDLPVADRQNDKIRQACRKDGLCVYENRGLGLRWFILPAGRAMIEKEARNG